MGQQGPLPFLEVGGVEVANAARTIAYLRKGLGNTQQGHWELGDGDVCSVLAREIGPAPISPTADPAPWYDPSEPGSATFLGFVLLDLDGYDSTLTRSVSAKIQGLGGGSFGRQQRQPRVWKFRGALVSADDAGAEYGLRWLTALLEASNCDGCSTTDLSVRIVCPPADGSNDDLGKWTSYDVALTDGPHEVDKYAPRLETDVLAGCRDLVLVEFTMTAGNPMLYKPPVLRQSFTLALNPTCTSDICEFLFGQPGDSHCIPVTPPSRGVLGAVYTLHSVDGFAGGLRFEAYRTCPSTNVQQRPDRTPKIARTLGRLGRRQRSRFATVVGVTTLFPQGAFQTHQRARQHPLSTRLSAPAVVSPPEDHVLALEILGVPAQSTVTIDSARHTITVTTLDPVTQQPVVEDASYLLQLEEGKGIQWIEVRDCDDIHCLCVRASAPCSSGVVDIAVQTQAREG